MPFPLQLIIESKWFINKTLEQVKHSFWSDRWLNSACTFLRMLLFFQSLSLEYLSLQAFDKTEAIQSFSKNFGTDHYKTKSYAMLPKFIY